MAGLPFSGCERGRLREAPIRTKGPWASGTEQGGRPDLRIEDSPGRKAGFRSALRHRWNIGLRPGDPPGRTGLRPGGCEERRTQRFGAWTARRNRGFGRGSGLFRDRGFGRVTGKTGSGTRVPNPPAGEPPGLRPWSGSQRGNRTGASASGRTPEEAVRRTPGPTHRPLETAQRGTPCLPGQVPADRKSVV